MRIGGALGQAGAFMHRNKRRRAVFIGSAIAMLSAGLALAQTASQIVPQSFQPALQGTAGGFDLPATSGLAAPDGAEKLSVHLSGLAIEGGLPALAPEEAALAARFANKTVTAAELFAAAGELETAYARAGYSLVRVVLPAQRVTDGTRLRIVVIDGFIERIDTAQLPDNIRERIASVLAPLSGQRGLTKTDIERRLLVAGDMPATVLRSTLGRGVEDGGSVLTIEARYKPVTGSINGDNTLSEALGHYSTSIGVDFNSPLGFGEQIYLRASGAPRLDGENGFFSDAPRNRGLAAGLTLPIGIDGLTLNLEGSVSRTAPQPGASGLRFLSDYARYSARLAYPLIRSRNLTVNLTGAFDIQNESQSLLNLGNFVLSQDRLRVLRAGVDLSWYAVPEGLLTARVTGSFGVDGLGARNLVEATTSGVPLSRQGADASFQKVDFALGYHHDVAEHLAIDLKARAQTAFGRPLLNAEQIGLAGATGLSTFGSGLMQGDDGFVVRGEVQFPFAVPFTLPFALPEFPAQQGTGLPPPDASSGALVVSPYVFAAYGGALLHQPTVLETAFTQGVSYGAGIRLGTGVQSSFSAINLNLEYGRMERFDNGADGDRFSLTAGFQF